MFLPVIFNHYEIFSVNILIANDDGVFAPGLQALAHALAPLGRVVVVAPESERSGFSSALTLDRPLRPIQISPDVWAVNGTPADCVYLSMNGLFDFEFDLVVSGINSGANLGDDVLYSGTVGAAFEGRLMKQPAIAVSMAGQNVRSYEHAKDQAFNNRVPLFEPTSSTLQKSVWYFVLLITSTFPVPSQKVVKSKFLYDKFKLIPY